MHVRSQYKKDMTINVTFIRSMPNYLTSITDSMYLQGVLPKKQKERVVVQVLNVAHVRPRPSMSLRQSI